MRPFNMGSQQLRLSSVSRSKDDRPRRRGQKGARNLGFAPHLQHVNDICTSATTHPLDTACCNSVWSSRYNTVFGSWDALPAARYWRLRADLGGNIVEGRDGHAFLLQILERARSTQAWTIETVRSQSPRRGETLSLNPQFADDLVELYGEQLLVIVYQYYCAIREGHRRFRNRPRRTTGVKPVFSTDSSWSARDPPRARETVGPERANFEMSAKREVGGLRERVSGGRSTRGSRNTERVFANPFPRWSRFPGISSATATLLGASGKPTTIATATEESRSWSAVHWFMLGGHSAKSVRQETRVRHCRCPRPSRWAHYPSGRESLARDGRGAVPSGGRPTEAVYSFNASERSLSLIGLRSRTAASLSASVREKICASPYLQTSSYVRKCGYEHRCQSGTE